MLTSKLLFVIGLSVSGCGHAGIDERPETADSGPAEVCVVRRAAYDIGSATTKVKVAEIDRCLGRVLKVLFADDAPVFYRDDVNGSVPSFSPHTMDRGMAVLRGFAEKAAAYEPSESAGVATSAFRRADNAGAMVERIEGELGIHVSVVSQLQEARIGFVGAVNMSGADPRQAVVWDVGGRSMQLTSMQANGRLFIYEGKLASGQMRDYVIREVKQEPPTVQSPNPLTARDVGVARAYAEAYASTEVPGELREKLASDRTVVVGIGALKYYGDSPASTRGASCTQTGLDLKIGALLGKSDDEIGGSYASTAVSDRILLAAFMKALRIQSVLLADIDLTDGLLFETEYWRSSETAQWPIFLRDRWGTRVDSSPSFAFGPSSVPHIVLQM